MRNNDKFLELMKSFETTAMTFSAFDSFICIFFSLAFHFSLVTFTLNIVQIKTFHTVHTILVRSFFFSQSLVLVNTLLFKTM